MEVKVHMFCTLRNLARAIYRDFLSVKIEKKNHQKDILFFIFLLNTLTVGTYLNRLGKAVLTTTNNICFGAKMRRKYMYIPLHTQFQYIKLGCKGVYFSWTCFHDVNEVKVQRFCKKRNCISDAFVTIA